MELTVTMHGVEIRDTRPSDRGHRYLSFDVRDILPLIDDPGRQSLWRCKNLDCLGERADAIYEVEKENLLITGEEFWEIMQGVYQSIDGEFEAFRDGEERPWLVIRAIDSSYFEVWCEHKYIVDRVRSNFAETKWLPPDRF